MPTVPFPLTITLCLTLDVIWWWLADRRLRSVRRARLWRVLVAVFMVAQIAYIGMLTVASYIPGAGEVGPQAWPIAGYLWHLMVLPPSLGGMVAVAVFGRLRRRLARPTADAQGPADASQSPAGPTRRQVLAAATVALPPLVAAGLTMRSAAMLGDFRIRRLELPVGGLPPDLDGLAIVHLTDLHIGRFLPAGMAERVADAANALAADLVVFTGDLCDGSAKVIDPAISFLRRLDPRCGMALVAGNHDCMKHADWFELPMRRAGLPLLVDQTTVCHIPGRSTAVQLMGLSWGPLVPGRQIGKDGDDSDRLFRYPSGPATTASLNRLLSQRQPDAFPILLSHNPDVFDEAAAAGLGLVLAGHTHGGQIMFTSNLGAGPIRFRYWSGVHEKRNSRLSISNGLGTWFPLRLNAPAEIVHLILRHV